MKRQMSVLSVGVVALTALSAVATSVVDHAAYADIHGLPSQYCTRVFQAAAASTNVHGYTKSVWCRNVQPRVNFYNAKGEWVATEPLVVAENQTAEQVVENVRTRISALPAAAKVYVVSMNSENNQSVEIYDAQGYLIATSDFRAFAAPLKADEVLPADVVNALAAKVSNPDVLKTLKVVKVTDVTKGRTVARRVINRLKFK